MGLMKTYNMNAHFRPSTRITFVNTDVEHLIILLGDGKILTFKQKEVNFSVFVDNSFLRENGCFDVLQIGHYGEKVCGFLELDESYEFDDSKFEIRVVRDALKELDNTAQFTALSRAMELNFWLKHRNYCGVCGSKLMNSDSENARCCPVCNTLFFPVIAPAIIVAISNGDKLLLAHNRKFRNGLYSLIAGFVEVGETLEQTVEREVFEEVGLKVKNIRYFSSQAWPFPNSIMVGFTAEYDSGDIKPDLVEITDAKWCSIDEFPALPSFGNLARALIEDFIARHS